MRYLPFYACFWMLVSAAFIGSGHAEQMPPSFREFQFRPLIPANGPVQYGGGATDSAASAALSGFRLVWRALGLPPRYDTRPLPPDVYDMTFGGTLRSYIYTYNYRNEGASEPRSVQVHFSIKWGDPSAPVEIYMPGMTTDAVHMFAPIAKASGTKGTKVFFDPVGIGFSETPKDLSAYKIGVSAGALQSALSELGLKPGVFILQSYGQCPWVYYVAKGQLTESVLLQYTTSPKNLSVQFASQVFKRHWYLGGLNIIDFLRALPFRNLIFRDEDGPALLYASLEDGISQDYLAVWSKRMMGEYVEPSTGLRTNLSYAFYALWDHLFNGPDSCYALVSKLENISYDSGRVLGNHSVHLVGGLQDHVTPASGVITYGRALQANPNFDVTISTVDGSHLSVSQPETLDFLSGLTRDIVPIAERQKAKGLGEFHSTPACRFGQLESTRFPKGHK